MKKSDIVNSSFLPFWFGIVLMLFFKWNYSSAQISSSLIKDQFSLKESPILIEQIRLHVDRNDFITGETIWFKAYYTLNNQFNKQYLSRIIYIELVDGSGISVAKGIYNLNNGASAGCVQIPESILSGYYTLYAYTKWMRNFDKSCYAKADIMIINPEKGVYISKSNVQDENKIMVDFHPEGGRLFSGYKNKIKCCVNGKNGVSEKIKGKIIDKNNMVITEFTARMNEASQFAFIPEKGENYRAIFTTKDSSNQIFNLPKAVDLGIGIGIDNESNDYMLVQIETNENTNESNKLLTIEFELNGFTYKTIKIPISNSKILERILKRDLQIGKNKITVYQQDGQIIYQDFFEVLSNENTSIDIISDKSSYGRRENVKLAIKTTKNNQIDKNVQLSISVAKLKTESNIGKEDKNWKSNSNNYKTKADSIQIKNKIEYLPETRGLILSGKVVSKSTNRTINNSSVYLSKLDKYILLQNTLSNSDGKFYFNLDNFKNQSDLVLQVANINSQDEKIMIDSEFSTDYPPTVNKSISSTDYHVDFYKNLLTNYQIQKQYSPNYKQDTLIKLQQTNYFYGKPDSTYFVNKFIDFATLEDFFNEIVSNVQVKKKKDNYEIEVRYQKNVNILTKAPILLLDGVPVFNLAKFLKISLGDIEKVEIINNYYILGDIKYGGIISLQSKKKNLANLAGSGSFTFYHTDGYAPKIEFTEKNYNSEQEFESRIPDFRNTLYWNPMINTNENGEAEISFYTSDEKAKYKVDIKGIGMNGEEFSKQLFFDIDK